MNAAITINSYFVVGRKFDYEASPQGQSAGTMVDVGAAG